MLENPAPMRAPRAAIFAAVCVALAAVGHSSMSGTDIPVGGLLAAFGVTGGLAWLAAGRRRGPLGIAGSLLAVQGVLHLVFSTSQAHGHPAPAQAPAVGAQHAAHHMPGGPGGPGGHVPGMDMSGMAAGAPDAAGAAGMAEMAGMAGHGGFAMIAAHVLAGLFCAVWLAWGEAALFRLLHALRVRAAAAAGPLRRLPALGRAHLPALPEPPAAAPSRDDERPRRLRGAVHAHAVVRRGPPGWPVTRATAPGRPACA
ncbi:hypothetical protein [Streptomyces venezuelae]|uniref:hypothetical protein n=1 Tax=Streptomyces venezuelae TaxID=54571 RepID=UPI001CC223F0|nr:hypothetical protein [Streptomyces venezuelae]